MKAIITGASAGIGKEIAIFLSQKGYDTVLVGRDPERLKETAGRINTFAVVEPVDLTDTDSVIGLFERHKDADTLVNCAGVGVFGEFDRTDLKRELDMIKVNISALHILTKLYYKEFVKKGRGNILNVASSAAFFVGPAYSSYYASKAYVHRLSLALSIESHRCSYGVNVSLFCPGPVKTDFGKRDGITDGKGAITPELAAKKAVEGMLRGKKIVYPNFSTKLLVCASKLLPEALTSKIVYKQQLKKANNVTLPLVKK